jgi:hypothetical protein
MRASGVCLLLSLALVTPQATAEEAQTLKERLSDKASDAQRVDNCHVPTERRGTTLRPDCPESPPVPTAEKKSLPPHAPR